MSYPIAELPEDTFLWFYAALFLVVTGVGQLLIYSGKLSQALAQRILTGLIFLLACLHFATDATAGRLREHWTGMESRSTHYLLLESVAQRESDLRYQYYWGPDRRILFFRRGGRRFAALPYVFLGAIALAHFIYRDESASVS